MPDQPKMTFVDAPDPETIMGQQTERERIEAAERDIELVGSLQEQMNQAALSQEEVDRYQELASAYSGIMLPLKMQLVAWEKYGEPPSGFELNKDIVGDMSLVDFLKEVVPLQELKIKFGVKKGVVDPEAGLILKERAVTIYTRCALELAEAEAIADAAKEELLADPDLPQHIIDELSANTTPAPRMVYFPAPEGAKLGRNGYIHLFPGYPDSPAGQFRGDGAAFNAQECVDFIGKHFPEIEDEFLNALADA